MFWSDLLLFKKNESFLDCSPKIQILVYSNKMQSTVGRYLPKGHEGRDETILQNSIIF